MISITKIEEAFDNLPTSTIQGGLQQETQAKTSQKQNMSGSTAVAPMPPWTVESSGSSLYRTPPIHFAKLASHGASQS
jgi:hypothetical protein